MNFIHDTGPKESRIGFAPAFAQDAPDAKLVAQPAEGRGEVQLVLAECLDRCEATQFLSTSSQGMAGREDNYG